MKHHIEVVPESVYGIMGIKRAVLDRLDFIEEQGGIVVGITKVNSPNFVYEIWWKK